MFCIGGICCEKVFSYMFGVGFEEVFYFKGGIFKYFEEVLQEQSLWCGDCFVFDNCVIVCYDFSEGEYDQCYVCCNLVLLEDCQFEYYVFGISCLYCWDLLSEKICVGVCEWQKQIELVWQCNQLYLFGCDLCQFMLEN